MNNIQAVKEIMVSGGSMCIFVTREIKMLELNKGDKVKVTFKKITE